MNPVIALAMTTLPINFKKWPRVNREIMPASNKVAHSSNGQIYPEIIPVWTMTGSADAFAGIRRIARSMPDNRKALFLKNGGYEVFTGNLNRICLSSFDSIPVVRVHEPRDMNL
jgi:hypothetical protein